LHRHSFIRHTHITEEIGKTISTREAEISNAITSTDTQLAEVEGALRDICLTDKQGQNEEDIRNAVKQIKEERATLGYSQKLFEELLLKISDDIIARAANESQQRSTKVIFGNNNSGFQVEIINGPISGISFGGK
jgi:hypothetical protein